MISSARGQAWQSADVCGSVPVYGRNVGRAFSPAAWGLRHRRVCRTMRASSPTDAGQGPVGVCGIPVGQSGNAPLRLRLAAHPPSGLRCPHRTARAEARLCSATAAPAPSRFLRRRRRSTPQPLAGEAVKQLPPKVSPVRGGGIASAMTEGCGAWPRQYPSGSPQTFPVLRHYRTRSAALAQNRSIAPPQLSPAGVNARPTI